MMPKAGIVDRWAGPKVFSIDMLHEMSVAWAQMRFAGKGEEILLGYFVVASQDGSAAVMHMPWEDDTQKMRIVRSLRMALAETPSMIAYSFICEAWALIGQAGEPHVKPSDHPDSEDVLNIWTSSRDGEHRMTRFGVRYYPLRLGQVYAKPPRLLERDDHGLAHLGEMAGDMWNFFESYEKSQKRMRRLQREMRR